MTGNFPIPGETFESRYRIERVLGAGGFAQVFLAKQLNLDRRVAIKVLKPTGEAHETWIARFEREAKVISKLKNANTVMMYDYGRTDGDLTYMVMEYVEGRELEYVLADRGTFSPAQTVAVLRQVLESLREAHALGIVHRDIKPANIIIYDRLGATDQIKLLDFGIAQVFDGDAAANALTADQSVVGTPSFMAPEQVTGEQTRPASDLYSVGLVAYELLTGTRAVDEASTIATMARHIADEPIKLPESIDVPQNLRAIVDTLLQQSLDRRYRQADEVLSDLDQWEANALSTNTASQPLVRYTSETQAHSISPPKQEEDLKKQVRLIALLVGAILVCGVIAGLLFVVAERMKQDDPETPAQAAAEIAPTDPDPEPEQKRAPSPEPAVAATSEKLAQPADDSPDNRDERAESEPVVVKKVESKKSVSRDSKPRKRVSKADPEPTAEPKPNVEPEPAKIAEIAAPPKPTVVEEKASPVEKVEGKAPLVPQPQTTITKKTEETKPKKSEPAEPKKEEKKKKKKIEIPISF